MLSSTNIASAVALDDVHARDVAANPAGVTATLSLVDGRTTFHYGERIRIRLTFENHSVTTYHALTWDPVRIATGRIDRFVTDRPADAVDPQQGRENLHQIGGFSGYWGLAPLTEKPSSVDIDLNQWLAFDKPGVYRFYDTTLRVSPTASEAIGLAKEAGTKPVATNIITVTILPRDLKWERSIIDSTLDSIRHSRNYHVCEPLVYLRTPEAGLTLLHLVEGRDPRAQLSDHMQFFYRGFVADSPYRSMLLADVERDVQDPNVGIDDTMLEDDVLLRQNRNEKALENGYIRSQVVAELQRVVEKKRGQARAVTLTALGYVHSYRGTEPYSRELVECFDLLPPDLVFSLLTTDTPFPHDPAIEPALVRFLESRPTGQPDVERSARAVALQRLVDFDSVAARRLIMAQIVRKYPETDPGVLLHLPGPIPNFDDVLQRNFDLAAHGKADLMAQCCLIGRYGTAAIRQQVESTYLRRAKSWMAEITEEAITHTSDDFLSPLFAFFFRVDPEFAEAHVGDLPFSGYASGYETAAAVDYSPGLRNALIAGLKSADEDVQYDCSLALGKYGGVEDKATLWSAVEPRSAANAAYATATAWILTDAEIARIAKYQPDTRTITAPSDIHSIDVDGDFPTYAVNRAELIPGLWRVDQYDLDTKADFEAKLLQFPAGSKFTLDTDGKRWRVRMLKEIRAFLTAHSMSIEDSAGYKAE